ncbi:DUF6368 family protein [Herbidospora sp. NBRC 101105]|uniref:DUF6368 family protein n=1 Tax=Herbidospora sp. NBRC 101105 TaxID=3032195 RepID=UPI0024A2F1AA|nr:DUF6368 family protein [Herbidospora sp. NBRC 101105]GLX93319.1 hypothetical protein Hesp01_12690 [Herbidospora sp. NBRC 101105]
MSRSSVTLWLFNNMDAGSWEGLAERLKRKGYAIVGGKGFSVYLETTPQVQARYPRHDVEYRFGVNLGEWDPDPEDDYSQVIAPQPVAELIAWSERDLVGEDVALGELVLEMTRQLNALIDFDGLLGPRPWLSGGSMDSHRKHVLEVRPFISSVGGTVYEVAYAMYGGEFRYVHVADGDFLEAWLAHPAFHLLEEWQ